MRPTIAIVGNGMVGHKMVDALVRRGATRTWDLVVVGEEGRAAYDRVHLSRLFEGASPADLTLSATGSEPDAAVSVLTGERAASIDRDGHTVTTSSGRVVAYDVAVLATGSVPFVPPVPGREIPGCFVYRTIDDVDAIRSWAAGRHHGVVVGGGLLGLEAANALRSCGLATEVVEFAPRLMPAQVVGAGPDGSVSAVSLAPADDPSATAELATEIVVFAAGIRPRDDIARACGLEVGERGGVVVDGRCRTSDPAIFTVGECALAAGRVHGLVAPGYQMARVAAETICGGEASFAGGDTPTKLKLLGVDVASFGDAHARAPGTATITFTDNVAQVHKRLVIDEGGRVAGGVLVGDVAGFDALAAIASILASQRSGHILDGQGAALQDTNDHFLANLQRDGTYSVVPRVPGGEITPEKLIVLGQVARDFGLYVKITGAQRIDLLGARVEALPAIWARLVDAGFESGHAYGKAVRTVKSCVGTNWCRFGVQDSTTLAIDLGLRYRGLRSPHKIKMAVSGCARECAEAQGKDVGVIATERGWNLYVGGNGGTRPRHAELLAADLDTETLVRSIDRFLMLYVRSADRLQRTATWMESLEGSIDHVRAVVFDDALGVADELDRDMARHVEGYRCEWAETLADPVRLRRFRTFVNSESPDPDIVVVQERNQPRPATRWERVELAATRS